MTSTSTATSASTTTPSPRPLAAYTRSADPVLRDLADGLVCRRLFKTLRLGPARRLRRRRGAPRRGARRRRRRPAYLGAIDRVEIDAYTDDEALMVLRSGGRVQRLLDASPLLRGLARERFVHYRAVFPPALRARVSHALADMTRTPALAQPLLHRTCSWPPVRPCPIRQFHSHCP